MFVSPTIRRRRWGNGRASTLPPSYGRFLQTDPIGYEDGPNPYAYTHNDPVNGVDPYGLDDLWCQVGWSAWGICGRGAGGQGGGSANGGSGPSAAQDKLERRFADKIEKQQNQRRKFSCADAMKESGQIRATGFNVTLVGILGWTWTTGRWWNMSTGTTGTFSTFGFGAGLEFGAGASVVTYRNIGAFTGGSDGYSVGAAVPLGPVAVGGSYQHSSNDSGSGSGGFGGVGPAAGIPPVGASGNFTTTDISQCKAGN